jgi:hypothetical protein
MGISPAEVAKGQAKRGQLKALHVPTLALTLSLTLALTPTLTLI